MSIFRSDTPNYQMPVPSSSPDSSTLVGAAPPIAPPAPPASPAQAPSYAARSTRSPQRGFASTILTSGAGLTTRASTGLKTLLGG